MAGGARRGLAAKRSRMTDRKRARRRHAAGDGQKGAGFFVPLRSVSFTLLEDDPCSAF